QARERLVGKARGQVDEAGSQPRACELGRAGSLIIAEPLAPQAQPQLGINGVKQVGRVSIPVGVLPLACRGVFGGVRLEAVVTAGNEDQPARAVELSRQIAGYQSPVVAVVVGLLRPGNPGRRPTVTLVGGGPY